MSPSTVSVYSLSNFDAELCRLPIQLVFAYVIWDVRGSEKND